MRPCAFLRLQDRSTYPPLPVPGAESTTGPYRPLLGPLERRAAIICEECAWEADAVRSGEFTHRDFRDYNKAEAYRHGGPEGHAACTGCDCHHQLIPGCEGEDDDN